MSKEVVLLFSGQGAQKVGMGKDLYETHVSVKGLFNRADEILGFGLTDVMFQGPIEELTRTSRCQPALYLHGLAVLQVLKEQLPSLKVVAAAGLSLGEFTAHAAAGTFDFETGLKLVYQRGRFMEEACEKTKGSMAAMIGGEESAVRELAAECDVDVANFNSPGQIVLSGPVGGIQAAMAKAKEKGIRKAVALPVAGAYHSRLMQSAQDQLAKILAQTPLQPPAVPVISNFAARAVRTPEDIRMTLEEQVTGSVRWVESMQGLLTQGHAVFLELGPGGVLAGFMARIQKGTTVYAIEDQKTLEAALGSLGLRPSIQSIQSIQEATPMSLGTKNRQRQNAELCKEHLRRQHAEQAALVEEFIQEIEGVEEEPDWAAWSQFCDIRHVEAEMLQRVEEMFAGWLKGA